MSGDSIAVDQQEDRQMIDDRTVYRLLDHIACEVFRRMRDGKTLEEIDDDLIPFLRKVDRIALFEHMLECFLPQHLRRDLVNGEEEADAIVAHLRALKRRKRSPQPTRPPATVLPFRPEDRPDL
jgi:hypothetical protein